MVGGSRSYAQISLRPQAFRRPCLQDARSACETPFFEQRLCFVRLGRTKQVFIPLAREGLQNTYPYECTLCQSPFCACER